MARRYRYCAFSIALGLSVMLTGVCRRLQGTCWSTLILFWRDIFEPYMPPYMSLRFGIIERHCNHIAIKRAIRGWGFFLFFFISSLGSPFSFSSTFSSFLGYVFQSLLAMLGYVIVEV